MSGPLRDLEGIVALVTGAGSPIGMGSAMSRALAARGARVALVDLRAQWLAETLQAVEAAGGGAGRAVALEADVSDPVAARRAVERATEALGPLDLLVNNAGTTPRAAGFTARSCSLWEVPVEAWHHVVSVNLNGAFHMVHAAVGGMIERGRGRVVGVTTSLSTMTRARATPYGPSKAGHEAFMAALAAELEGSGVTANILVPGGRTDTHFFAGRAEGERSGFLSPEIMGPPIAWLASRAADGVNGLRIIASRWDESLPLRERLDRASGPVAWPDPAAAVDR